MLLSPVSMWEVVLTSRLAQRIRRSSLRFFERVGMAAVFAAVIDRTKISKGKPDPEVFTKGAAELEVRPAECVVFEDAVAGVEAGKRGGMFVVGLGSPDVLTQADLVAPSLDALTVEEVLNAAERK